MARKAKYLSDFWLWYYSPVTKIKNQLKYTTKKLKLEKSAFVRETLTLGQFWHMLKFNSTFLNGYDWTSIYFLANIRFATRAEVWQKNINIKKTSRESAGWFLSYVSFRLFAMLSGNFNYKVRTEN